jgi:hypothetical protein
VSDSGQFLRAPERAHPTRAEVSRLGWARFNILQMNLTRAFLKLLVLADFVVMVREKREHAERVEITEQTEI